MPRSPDPERRRELARRAVAFLRARGLHRVTMRELAQALELKRPTLYFYFPDLGAVFEAALAELVADERELLARALRGIDHPIDRLEAMLRASLRFGEAREADAVFLIQLWALRPSRTGDDATSPAGAARDGLGPLLEPMAVLRELLVRDLRRGIDRGIVAPCEPDTVLDLCLATLDGLTLHRVLRGVDVEALLDRFVATMLTPLRRPNDAPEETATL